MHTVVETYKEEVAAGALRVRVERSGDGDTVVLGAILEAVEHGGDPDTMEIYTGADTQWERGEVLGNAGAWLVERGIPLKS